MSNDTTRATTHLDSTTQPNAGAVGVTVVAGTLMIMIGVFHAFQGIVALLNGMPYYPLWSLTVIALDIFIIWAAILHGRDIVAE